MSSVKRVPPTKPEALRAENARLRKEVVELGRMNRTMLQIVQGFATLEKRAHTLLRTMPEGEQALIIKSKIKAYNALPEPTFHLWCLWRETVQAAAVKSHRAEQVEADEARGQHAALVLDAARTVLANEGVRAWFEFSDDGGVTSEIEPTWDALKAAVENADRFAARVEREHEQDMMFHYPAERDAERFGLEEEYLNALRAAVLRGKYRVTFPPSVPASQSLINQMDALANYGSAFAQRDGSVHK